MEFFDLNNTGPEVQERLDLVPVTKADLDQEVLDRIEGDQRVLAESRAYCDLETARAMQVEANLQAQIDAIVGSRLTITVSKDVGVIYVGVPTTINFVIGTSMDVTSCKLMRGDVEVASSDVPGSNFAFADTLTVASDIGRVSYSVIAVLGGIERIQPVEIPVEKQTPAFAWNPAGDVTVTEGQYTPSDFPALVNVPAGLTVVCSSTNPAVATVNSSGVVTVVGVGECTIKAESQATDVYKAKSAMYKLTVNEEGAQWTVGGTPSDGLLYTVNLNSNIYTGPEIKLVGIGSGRTVTLSYEEVNQTTSYQHIADWWREVSFNSSTGVLLIPNRSWYGASHQVGNDANAPAECNIKATIKEGTTKIAEVIFNLKIEKADIEFGLSSTDPVIVNLSGVLAPGETETFNNANGLPTVENYSSQIRVVGGSSTSGVSSITIKNGGIIEVKVNGPVDRAPITIASGGGSNSNDYKVKYYSYMFRFTAVAPENDYYVGWSKGTSFDDFAAMTAEQLAALAEPYNKTAQPSVTKTVTAADISGVTREILFLMWKDGSAPNDGVFGSGGFVEQLSAQDFTDPNIFNASHANVTIEGETFHVSGMRLGFNVGDSLTVNF